MPAPVWAADNQSFYYLSEQDGSFNVYRRNIVTIHLTLENSKGEVCDEGEAIYFTFGPDKAKEMGFDCCKVEGEVMG